ncbi:lysylphosphatidylglycerol synthase transmembrane domain-containing protein [Sphingobium sp. H39-3-25]|uniref:lysylphosphatidylglycerol synthase transmembrane domain-containing protein n=1 Tax=Sphingobium arseniciresistens TaxID=3030834 RepID=UPI0023B9738E|nr:lysylphosphatidylglycerol synthase transmembrane domain-containing protein [Sphingobium arseniciresistens]
MTQGHAAQSPRRSQIARLLAWLIGLAALVMLLRHFADLEHFLTLARQTQPIWLLVALALQAGTYVAVARGWAIVLRRAGAPQPLRKLLPVAVSKLFADQALPGAGLGGHVLLVDRLMALGTPRSTAIAALLISMVGYYAAYAALAVLMLLVLWLHRHATPLLVGLVTTFLLVALAIPALALWLRHRGSQPLPPWLERLGPVRKILVIMGEAPGELVGDRRLLVLVSLLNGCVFIADSVTLATCLLALGLPFEPATAFLALMAGSIAATLAPIPLGLGSFEASATAMLSSLGIPFEAALTATLLLRGLTLWLPLLPSLVMMRRGGYKRGDRT